MGPQRVKFCFSINNLPIIDMKATWRIEPWLYDNILNVESLKSERSAASHLLRCQIDADFSISSLFCTQSRSFIVWVLISSTPTCHTHWMGFNLAASLPTSYTQSSSAFPTSNPITFSTSITQGSSALPASNSLGFGVWELDVLLISLHQNVGERVEWVNNRKYFFETLNASSFIERSKNTS